MRYINEKVESTLNKLSRLIVVKSDKPQGFKVKECGYKTDNNIPAVTPDWEDFADCTLIDAHDVHFWTVGTIKTPSIGENEYVALSYVEKNKNEKLQALLYLNGEIVTEFDENHTYTKLEPDTQYSVAIYSYYQNIRPYSSVALSVDVRSSLIEKLYYDLLVPYDVTTCMAPESDSYIKIMGYLEKACNLIDFRSSYSDEFYQSISLADEYMMTEFYNKACNADNPIVHCLGHSHIDLAWTWTLEQTREKIQRTVSNVIKCMDEYPEFTFMLTQPQILVFLKEEAPELYERVKEKVREGRFEIDGAMWVESDGNLPSGESFVRQVLFGKAFIKDEFGVDSKTLWIPDVFGYSAALPQILKKSGVERFVTGKISWNDTNRMPNDTFYWKGIDGTEIFTQFLTTKDFINPDKSRDFVMINGVLDAQEVKSTWDIYRNKEYNNDVFTTYGYGDGGGGPTYDMIQRQRRLSYGLPGMPVTKPDSLDNILNTIKENFDASCERLGRIPKWSGELYLEYHRGTYTSIAKNKKNNRESEFLLQNAEVLSVIANSLANCEYEQGKLNDAWRLLLQNQFHDIIPGSSIKEVYDQSDKDYAKIKESVGEVVQNSLEAISSQINTEGGYFVYNPHSYVCSDCVKIDDKTVFVKDIPSFGWRVVTDYNDKNSISVSDNKISNKYFDITFDDDMDIISIVDKVEDRELIKKGNKANRFVAYEDVPRFYDAWEITNYYNQKPYYVDRVINVKSIDDGARAGLCVEKQYRNSVITQYIYLYEDIRKVDFETKIDWKEEQTLLKTLFPLNIMSDKITSEIQFGSVERNTHSNTSWDEAKFEMCMHKWIDMSDNSYGISFLNDCKYGFSADENVVGLTLLKSAISPHPNADKGTHEFTYSLYPHSGGPMQGGTVRAAYNLNNKMLVKKLGKQNGSLKNEYSFIQCDCDNVILETVKKAEDGSGTILRLYDAGNMSKNVTLHFAEDITAAYECDMLENEQSTIDVADNSLTFKVNNFEIKTIKVK